MHVKRLKILCLSICALAGLMAINVSTAQAKWLILRNGVSVESIKETITIEEWRLLVPALGIQLLCKGGTGTFNLSGGGGTALTTAKVLTLNGCVASEFEEVCKVRDSTNEVGSGKITFAGSGEGSMTGASVFFTASSTAGSPFTNIIFEGGECPFVEIGGKTYGSLTFQILEPLTNVATHPTDVSSQNLQFFGNPTVIENAAGGTLKGSLTDSGNQPLSFHLRELPGCPSVC